MVIKKTTGQNLFDILNIVCLLLLTVVTLYPFIHVTFASISVPDELIKYRGLMWKPLGFSLEAYKSVFKNPMISYGYINTILYVSFGTAISLLLTIMGAYVLSRRGYYWKNILMFMVILTMFFQGGLIPSYLLVKSLGGINQPWALILPVAINTWNLIIMRTSFAAIPVSLEESSRIDGANDFTILFRIIVPLSMPVIAVMILYYGVGYWNSWFNAMLYLRTKTLYPLQLVLREILINSNMTDMMEGTSVLDREQIGETIKYATIIVATIPILCIYPMLQKYFIKGIMVGALKE